MPYLFTYILADDDATYREFTIQQLNTIPDLKCLAICDSAIATRNMLQEHTPDFLVLDVEMPGLTGIQLAKSLKNLPLTIFITSHPSYAVEAFELDAVDYLVKPAAPERLLRAIDKVKMLVQLKRNSSHEDSFKIVDKDSFFIKDKGAFIKINCADVLYAESLGDFVTIFLQNCEKKIALVSMKNFEQQLPSSLFIRISRTHLVNKQKVTAIEHNMVHINNIALHIGTTYIDVVMQNIIGDSAIKRFI